MIVHANIDGTDITSDILHDSVRVKFLTEDDEHYFGISSVDLTVSNMNGVRAGLLEADRAAAAIRIDGVGLLSKIVEAVSVDRDNETITLTLMSRDRDVLDKLAQVKIIGHGQDYQGLWTLLEGAAQYRVWTRIDKILERALNEVGYGLVWEIGQLSAYNLVLGGLSPAAAQGVTPPVLLAELPIVGRIYRPQHPHLPDWDAATLLGEVSRAFNLYWTVIGSNLHIKSLNRWSDLTGPGVSVPLEKDSLSIEYGEAGIGRVEMSFANAMPEGRQAPAGTTGVLEGANGSDTVKQVSSKFALTYDLSRDYHTSLYGVAVLPQDVEGNHIVVLSSGVNWDQQHSMSAAFALEGYSVLLHEVGRAQGSVSVMDDPDLISSLAIPYQKVRIPELGADQVALVTEATLNPHSEKVEFTAAIYEGLNL